MASSSSSSPRATMMSSYSCEMRPKMLKDFLSDDPSCSSSTTRNNGIMKKTHSGLLLRTRSKSASISISAIHKASEAVIKAIKFFPFAARHFPRAVVKIHAPSLLPRSISRKKSSSSVIEEQEQTTPKIKDILRWKSFRDVVEELSTSWLEDDFSSDDLTDHHQRQNGCFSFDGDEQQSPVSVLNDSPFRDDHHHGEDDQEPILFCTMEKRKNKVMQAIAEEFEAIAKQEDHHESETNWEVEEKAWQLLEKVKASSSSSKLSVNNIESNDIVLLDFFMDALADEELSEIEMVKVAHAWVNKVSYHGEFDGGLLDNRKACLLDMENGPMGWRKSPYCEEQQELGLDLEAHILDDMLDELWKELEQRI